jgi:hypothetical protein
MLRLRKGQAKHIKHTPVIWSSCVCTPGGNVLTLMQAAIDQGGFRRRASRQK